MSDFGKTYTLLTEWMGTPYTIEMEVGSIAEAALGFFSGSQEQGWEGFPIQAVVEENPISVIRMTDDIPEEMMEGLDVNPEEVLRWVTFLHFCGTDDRPIDEDSEVWEVRAIVPITAKGVPSYKFFDDPIPASREIIWEVK